MKEVIGKTSVALMAVVLVGCENEQPPRSVHEFMENPILLEAAVVRCAQNRAETRYDPECMNAREAVKIIEAAEEAERRAELEAMSERKRQALRRTQRAAAEARRRAQDEQRRREEAEYLAQFGELPPGSTSENTPGSANAPVAVIPAPAETTERAPISSPYDEPAPAPAAPQQSVPAPAPAASSNAPVAEMEPDEPESDSTDLEAIREELRRRSEDGS